MASVGVEGIGVGRSRVGSRARDGQPLVGRIGNVRAWKLRLIGFVEGHERALVIGVRFGPPAGERDERVGQIGRAQVVTPGKRDARKLHALLGVDAGAHVAIARNGERASKRAERERAALVDSAQHHDGGADRRPAGAQLDEGTVVSGVAPCLAGDERDACVRGADECALCRPLLRILLTLAFGSDGSERVRVTRQPLGVPLGVVEVGDERAARLGKRPRGVLGQQDGGAGKRFGVVDVGARPERQHGAFAKRRHQDGERLRVPVAHVLVSVVPPVPPSALQEQVARCQVGQHRVPIGVDGLLDDLCRDRHAQRRTLGLRILQPLGAADGVEQRRLFGVSVRPNEARVEQASVDTRIAQQLPRVLRLADRVANPDDAPASARGFEHPANTRRRHLIACGRFDALYRHRFTQMFEIVRNVAVRRAGLFARTSAQHQRIGAWVEGGWLGRSSVGI